MGLSSRWRLHGITSRSHSSVAITGGDTFPILLPHPSSARETFTSNLRYAASSRKW